MLAPHICGLKAFLTAPRSDRRHAPPCRLIIMFHMWTLKRPTTQLQPHSISIWVYCFSDLKSRIW
jgi:hypothetical protein